MREGHGGARHFDNMHNLVMVDEKWFYMLKQGQKYTTFLEGEEVPIYKVQHKSHIQKVMFLAVVARPRRDTVANRNFDGKIGIFPVHEAGVCPTQQQEQGCRHDGDEDGRGDEGGLQGEDAERCVSRHQAHVAGWPIRRRRATGQRAGPQDYRRPGHRGGGHR